MNSKKCFLLLFASIVIHSMAQELYTLARLNYESPEKNIQRITQESDEKVPAMVSGSLFIRNASFLDYNFKQESIYYTPALQGGFGLMYNRLYFEISSFIGKDDNYGCALDFVYSLRAKNLDENWKSTMGVIGEASYFPAQQGNPDLWIYTAGLCYMIYRPFKWGTPSIGFLLGGSYYNEEVSLNSRMMLNLSVPIF
ncbi:MAG: hypothetical protein JSV22_02395 [Bacteroidales bacterium]|nr:MAG: hypothetical protein JSV22_02395 [Bacteroidales bacterium]